MVGAARVIMFYADGKYVKYNFLNQRFFAFFSCGKRANFSGLLIAKVFFSESRLIWGDFEKVKRPIKKALNFVLFKAK